MTAALLQRCRQGDQQAWEELVEATHREVYTLCLRILKDPDDAAEATQDAYLKAWRGLKGFRGESMFTTWLYRVATNAAISKHRSRSRRRRHETGAQDEVLTQVAHPASTEGEAGARIGMEDLEKVLAALPDHYRLPLVMKDVYGMDIEEIAKSLKISDTATKVRLHRGRKKLRDMLLPRSEGE